MPDFLGLHVSRIGVTDLTSLCFCTRTFNLDRVLSDTFARYGPCKVAPNSYSELS